MEVSCDVDLIKDPSTRKANVSYVASHIVDSLNLKQYYRQQKQQNTKAGGLRQLYEFCTTLSRCCCLCVGKRQGNYLTVLYLVTKFLYIANLAGQFALMSHFLNTNYTLYGVDMLRDLAMGYSWQESGNFPRITMCDFQIRKLANMHLYTVQCVLPINMFNEKIYLFLWFWCLLVTVITVSSFLQWTIKSACRSTRVHFVQKFLTLRQVCKLPNDKKRLAEFLDEYLRHDGVFIVRLISVNVGELVAVEVTEKLWKMFLDDKRLVSVKRPAGGGLHATAAIATSHIGSSRSHHPHASASSSQSSRRHLSKHSRRSNAPTWQMNVDRPPYYHNSEEDMEDHSRHPDEDPGEVV